MNIRLIDFDETSNEEKVIKCGKLNNDIIFMKYDISLKDIIEVSENEFVILIDKGQVYDYKENGKYIVSESDTEIEERFKNLYIRDAENKNLCVIFLNKNIIKTSKLLIENFNIKEDKSFMNIEVVYDFKIEDFKKFLYKTRNNRKN